MVGRIFLWFGFFFSQKRNELAAAKLHLKSLDLKPQKRNHLKFVIFTNAHAQY